MKCAGDKEDVGLGSTGLQLVFSELPPPYCDVVLELLLTKLVVVFRSAPFTATTLYRHC